MYKIELCDKCKATNIKSLVPKIKCISDDIQIQIHCIQFQIHCIQFCGIGRNKIVVLLDHFPIIGDTEDEVLEKIRYKINGN